MSAYFDDLAFVSTAWLAERIHDPALRIVDGSWHLPPTGRNGAAEYKAGHIPGAVFVDIDDLADKSSGLPHMLPSEAQFAQAIGALGISNSDLIVVYDQTGLFSAPRVAWMLRIYGAAHVHLLEGGLPRWSAEGRAMTAAASTPKLASFTAKLDRAVIATIETVAQNLESNAVQVVDARPALRFKGAAPEPRPGVRAGHMPGSINLPFDKLVENGALKSAEDIQAALINAGIDPTKPAICSCGSGVSAAIIALALTKAGAPVASIYDGSWAEWGSREEYKIATGTP